MSFEKKIFSDSNNKAGDDKPDIDKLLSSSDPNKSIDILDNYICKLSSLGEKLDCLTEQQKNFYFSQNLKFEINNGGFAQFFFNSSGNFAHETLLSLNAIGANETAVILQLAMDQFPSSRVPKDIAERRQLLEKIEEKADEVWEQLNERFYTHENDLDDLNIQYIKQNRKYF